jgi:hypothetical protein
VHEADGTLLPGAHIDHGTGQGQVAGVAQPHRDALLGPIAQDHPREEGHDAGPEKHARGSGDGHSKLMAQAALATEGQDTRPPRDLDVHSVGPVASAHANKQQAVVRGESRQLVRANVQDV